MKWLDILKVVTTVILPLIHPKLASLSPLIIEGISEAESIPNASGPDKLKHVVDLVNTGVMGVNIAAGKEIVDPTIVNAISGKAISTIVDVTNIISKNK